MDDGKYVVVESKEEKEQLKEKRSKPKRRGNIEPLNYDEGSIDLGLDQEDLEWFNFWNQSNFSNLNVKFKNATNDVLQ